MSEINRRALLKASAALIGAPGLLSWNAGSLLGAEPIANPKPKEPEVKPKNPYADAKFVAGPPPLPSKDSFTVAVLPDTQHYMEKHPQNFFAQTEWIAANAGPRKIAAVFHLGDVTNWSKRSEWEVAREGMSRLDGHVPYFMVPGNHDYSDGVSIANVRQTLFSEYFPRKKFEDLKTFGGVYDREPDRFENSYHTFTAAGRKFLVLALEYGPRKDVVRWANEVVARFPEHEAILVTHAYLYYDDTRYDWNKYGEKQRWNPHASGIAKSTDDDVFDGEQLWQQLVSKHDNFILTINGHVLYDGLGHNMSHHANGKTVHEVLVNFQMKPNGGDGWLRLLEFAADGSSISAIDYSPTRNECNVSKQNRFSMAYPQAKA